MNHKAITLFTAGLIIALTTFSQANASSTIAKKQSEPATQLSNLRINETLLSYERDGIYLHASSNVPAPGIKSRTGPYELSDIIPEPYGLKNKLLEFESQGLNIRGITVKMIDIEGEHLKFLQGTSSLDDPRQASAGTFFFKSDISAVLSQDSFFTLIRSGNDNFPQINISYLKEIEETTFADANAARADVEQKLVNIKHKDITKAGLIKSKQMGTSIVALRFKSPTDSLYVQFLIESEIFKLPNSKERYMELTGIVNSNNLPHQKSYEHLVALSYSGNATTEMYYGNISIFLTKASAKYTPVKPPAPPK